MPKNLRRKATRDVDRIYSNTQFVAKLRRLADAIERDARFVIQISGERIHVPEGAIFSIEHEKSNTDEEIEFQIRWSLKRDG